MLEHIGSAVQQILLGLLGLSFLVFIHELGHFLMAKYHGVRVRVFSIGFGKKLFCWRRGDTVYCLSAIPFGGYVAMAGENPETEKEDPQPGDFTAQPVRARAAIAIAGPAINILFAILTLFILYLVGVPEPITDRLIVGFVEQGAPGQVAGLVPGDTIIAINGKVTKGWEKFNEEVTSSIGVKVSLTVIRLGGETQEVKVVPQEFRDLGIGWVGVFPRHRVLVAVEPTPGSPAADAGVHKGDTLLRVEGHPATSYQDVMVPIAASKGKQVQLAVRRGNDSLNYWITPRWDETQKRFIIGIQMLPLAFNEDHVVRRGPVAAVIKSLETNWQLSTSIFRYIGRMAKGQVKTKALSGPVGIVSIIGLYWLESFHDLMMILALISVNLGVMNLLPLAITDGGILMFLIIEALRGKPLSRTIQARIQQVATAFFITLFLYLTFQDIGRFSMFLR